MCVRGGGWGRGRQKPNKLLLLLRPLPRHRPAAVLEPGVCAVRLLGPPGRERRRRPRPRRLPRGAVCVPRFPLLVRLLPARGQWRHRRGGGGGRCRPRPHAANCCGRKAVRRGVQGVDGGARRCAAAAAATAANAAGDNVALPTAGASAPRQAHADCRQRCQRGEAHAQPHAQRCTLRQCARSSARAIVCQPAHRGRGGGRGGARGG